MVYKPRDITWGPQPGYRSRILGCTKHLNRNSSKLGHEDWKMPMVQWPFQEPKLEVPNIYKAYFSGLCKGIYPQNMDNNMVLTYLHFRILEFPWSVWGQICGRHILRSLGPGCRNLGSRNLWEKTPRLPGWWRSDLWKIKKMGQRLCWNMDF